MCVHSTSQCVISSNEHSAAVHCCLNWISLGVNAGCPRRSHNLIMWDEGIVRANPQPAVGSHRDHKAPQKVGGELNRGEQKKNEPRNWISGGLN